MRYSARGMAVAGVLIGSLSLWVGVSAFAQRSDSRTQAAGGGSENAQKQEDPFRIELTKSEWDPRSELLSLRAEIRNPTAKSVFVVLPDFAFTRLGNDLGHHLRCVDEKDELTFDLSHAPLTQEGRRLLRGEWGAWNLVPDLVEIRPGEVRTVTFAFQFPLALSWKVSERNEVAAPKGSKVVRLRFGIAAERYHSFHQREFRRSDDWEKRLVEEWQRPVLTNGTTIDFGR